MTREELREKVIETMFLHKASDAAVDAAIAIIRGETLEEAARVAESNAPACQDMEGTAIADRCDLIAAAIRALKDQATT